MNYQKVYDQLVQKNHTFSKGEYFETHHKVPKSLGGTDDENNLVNLTAREHYIAHLLLVKITEQKGDTQAYSKMLYAFNCMKWGRCDGERSFKYNSRLYQVIKEQYAKLRSRMMKTNHNPSKGKIWIYSDDIKQNKQWDKNLPIPKGWKQGRVVDWSNKEKQQRVLLEQKRIKELEYSRKVIYYTEMYNDYLEHGLQYVRDKYNYDKSGENLTRQFRRYVSKYNNVSLRKAAMKLLAVRHRYNETTIHMSQQEKAIYFTKVYEFYIIHGFKETKEKFNWTKTRNALTYNFRTYVQNYVPYDV